MTDPPTHIPAASASETQAFDPRALRDHPLLGQVVANYHVTGIIGQGGQGTVYRARDIKLDRNVALKVLRYPEDDLARAGLMKEARALAGLGTHPHIVPIYAWGELDASCYFALEHLPASAATLLREHPQGLETRRALAIVQQCAEALAHAHGKGLLHLDIKPANILLDGETAKLCDFGLAQFYSDREHTPMGTSGSPAYMSPEQMRGDVLGPAADIFALGVTAYQLICGRLPFSGDTTAEIVQHIQAGASVPLEHYMPQAPRALVELLRRCIAAEPLDRFPSAEALADAVRALAQPSPATRSARPALRPYPVMVAALVAVMLGGIVIPLFLGDGGRALKTVEAEGRSALERGDYDAAALAYKTLVSENPGDDHLLYGLGYAHLLAGDFAGAEAAFAQIHDTARAAEGQAATAQARHERAAGAKLEQAGSDYAIVLLATNEIAEGAYAAARSRLEELNVDNLEFDWQRARLWQALGQAHFRLGELPEARQAFEQAERLGDGPASHTASDYLAITQQELAQREYEQLSAQISRVKSLRDATPAVSETDTWSSRPLQLWIPPATATRSLVAVESGLADVLPWKLSKALTDQTAFPIGIVDRNYTAALLQEQELSAQLSSKEDAVRLGRLLGARLALFCRFNTVLGEESLNAELVDVETSRTIPLDEVPLNGTIAVTEWVGTVSDLVIQAVKKAFPLRGVVRGTAAGAAINIGAEQGLQPGMRLKLMTGPGGEFALPEIYGVVQNPVDSTSAPVVLEGAGAVPVPETGWFAEVTATENADA